MKKPVTALIIAILMIINTVPAFADSGDITIQQIIPALENWASQINDGENRSFTTVSSIGLSPYSGVPLFTATASGYEVSKVYIDSGNSLAFAFYSNYPYFGTHVVDSNSQVQARLRGNKSNTNARVKFAINNKTVTYAFMDNLVFTPDSYGYVDLVAFLSLYGPEVLITSGIPMTIPPGYALIIDKGKSGTFNGFFMSTIMPSKSPLFGGTWYNGVSYRHATRLNEIDFSFDLGSIQIPWEKVPNTGNLLGRTSNASYEMIDMAFTRYFVLINPVSSYQGGANVNDADFLKNNPINFVPRGTYKNAFLIPLTQSLNTVSFDFTDSQNNYVANVTETEDGYKFNGFSTLDEISESVVSDSSPVTDIPTVSPVAGGNTPQDSNISLNSGGIFSNGKQSLENLSGEASDFFRFMRSIFDWLPPQVVTVISSALVLLIAIGVVKVIL